MTNRVPLKYGDKTRAIIGVFYDVYNALGYGFLEKVYENSLAHKLRGTGYTVKQQAPLTVYFEDIVVGEFFADLIVDETVILELKAVEKLAQIHTYQLYNYLHATDCEVGLLLNFGPKPEFQRVFLENARKSRNKK